MTNPPPVRAALPLVDAGALSVLRLAWEAVDGYRWLRLVRQRMALEA